SIAPAGLRARRFVVAGGRQGALRLGAGTAGPVVERGGPDTRGHDRSSVLRDRNATALLPGLAGRIAGGGRPNGGGSRPRDRGTGRGRRDGREFLRSGVAPPPGGVAAAEGHRWE